MSGTKDKTVVVSGQNSQTVPLLQASSESRLAQGGPDIVIENAALVADSGPVGSSAEGIVVDVSDSPIQVYTVKKGDTVGSIAKAFNTSETSIVSANDLKRSKALSEGQNLVILRVPGALYKVKKGDTLGAIARKFKVDSDEIISVNGFDNANSIVAGDEILIPGVDGGTAALAEKKPEPKKVAVKEKPKAVVAQKDEEASVVTTPEVVAPLVTTPAPVSSGAFFAKPVEGRLTQGLHDGNAIDVGAPIGTVIRAAADGEVVVARGAGYNGGYGLYVVISHDYNGKTVQTLYAHMSRVATVAGTSIKQGDVIGYVGSTGRSTGPHLHFEVRGGAKNPGLSWY